jgi:hypothetical protein
MARILRQVCQPPVVQYKKEWRVYRRTYNRMVRDSTVAKSLEDKCINGDVKLMIGAMEDLQ